MVDFEIFRVAVFVLLFGFTAPLVHNEPTDLATGRRTQRSAEYQSNFNHKPTLNCEGYKPEIKEEQPAGTYVIDVKAHDVDPPDTGGTITYSIVTQTTLSRQDFIINNETGRIVTRQVFDRDEPTRQKELYITVKATDNGKPQLADVCTFKVIILDINDNAPTFDTSEYSNHVSEDLKEGGEVMRVFAYDFDDGENARLTYSFSGDSSANSFEEYFQIDPSTGVIYLKKSLAQKKDMIFTNVVTVRDGGKPPSSSRADVSIKVVGSDKRPPMFITPTKEITLEENFNKYNEPIVTLEAVSNIENPGLVFELITGKTTHTNKDQTFQAQPKGSEVAITLARPLDYETVTYYNLTMRVTNKDKLAALATVNIVVLDVNDEVPNYVEVRSGSVSENEEAGVAVMQVRAIDKDGTSPNNVVSYALDDHQDLFDIDANTGMLTTRQTFDRELNSSYIVYIRAYDNAPSALVPDKNEPNSVTQTFRIDIADRNDNKPQFEKSLYVVENISEAANLGKDVIHVKATDNDTESVLRYSITAGNVDGAFYMEEATGRIKVNNTLDFEKIENYTLEILASDGIYNDTANVIIYILNENDEPPVFDEYDKNISIMEESIPDDCIITMKARDPDIKDPNADQKIVYRVEPPFLNVTSENGVACVRLIKELDRDRPEGSPTYQGFIYANDNEGVPTTLGQYAELNLILEDINDNAPFLNMTEVVWFENRTAGIITQLTADDYDSNKNGPPFTYRISDNATEEIKMKFSVVNDNFLQANVVFDREEKKYYDVLIAITDSGTPYTQTGESYIRVIIGDINDNPAKPGSSEIFVYSYNDGWPDPVVIGRVYVDDPDDWDLPDKTFDWMTLDRDKFVLDEYTGNITMQPGLGEGTYELKFLVTESPSSNYFEEHSVEATVTVTVKSIPEEAVRKSGSIRLEGASTEEFVEKSGALSLSRKDLLQQHMASVLNTSLENVDIFTVARARENASLVDVRFSAHGSPYYAPEKLNSKVNLSSDELEKLLDISFNMIDVKACVYESACAGKSCYNKLTIEDMPSYVYTNKTSFVGVNAYVEAVCECAPPPPPPVECFNGGTPDGAECRCTDGFEGPRCEILSVSFYGDGWALYPNFDACNDTEVTLEVQPSNGNGLIFYAGPSTINPPPLSRDFMALQLEDGYPVLLLDYGKGTTRIKLQYRQLTDGASHSIKISYSMKEGIQLSIDDCHKSDCLQLGEPKGNNTLLHLSGPLQVGGAANDIRRVANYWKWEYVPTTQGYHGCIRNFTYNNHIYNLGQPGEYKNAYPSCNYGTVQAVSFGIDSKFLVAILVCIAILLILLLAVVVHRRKQDNWNEKDTDDARENIIDYQVEGGGEYDTDFNLDILRRCEDDEKPPIREEPADIGVFLDSKKDTCDKDPENLPYDDVRYYAYEGDGNSTGSLSSLASCTDEGDMKFNYLSSFGPRFRKLADMYGEEPSDEDSHDGGEESWC